MVARALLIGAAGVSCGEDGGGFGGEIEFEGQQAFLPGFEQDTGWIPAESPASIRVVARGEGGVVAKARATTDGSALTPVEGSGELTSNGKLLLEVSARLNTAGFEFEGVVDSFSYVIEPATTMFEPFLLDTTASVESALPASQLASVPVPSVPGATLIIDVTGGSLTTTFQGVCAETAEGVGQYTGQTRTSGVIELGGTIEIEIPIVGSESFGPFPLTVDIPELVSAIDLGSRSLETAEAVDGVMPCDGNLAGTGGGSNGDSSGDLDTGPGATATTDDGTTTSPPTTSMTSVDETGMTGHETGGVPSDPEYPNPDVEDCPPGTVSVISTEMPVVQFCSPACAGDFCPEAATGTAAPWCALSPLSSFDPCDTDADCVMGEICDLGTCLVVPFTHCALLCDAGEFCPEGMICHAASVCGYPV